MEIDELNYENKKKMDALYEKYGSHPVIKHLTNMQETIYKDDVSMWNQINHIERSLMESGTLSTAPTPVSSEEGLKENNETNSIRIAIREIEKRKSLHPTPDHPYSEGKYVAYNDAIIILQTILNQESPTPSTPQGEVEQAAKEWVENHDDAFVRGQFGTHYRAFLAGASWQSLSSESSGAVELWNEVVTEAKKFQLQYQAVDYLKSKFHLTRKQSKP